VTQQAPPDAQQPPRITEAKVRETLSKARRVVVKIGSRSLAAEPNMPAILAAQVRNLIDQGRTVALVSSGAVALGCTRLGFSERPKEVPLLQAAASAGQSELMRRYDQAFMAEGIVTAQVLITHSDLSNRKRLNNARSALKAL
jgi:glutamate 5-kinase